MYVLVHCTHPFKSPPQIQERGLSLSLFLPFKWGSPHKFCNAKLVGPVERSAEKNFHPRGNSDATKFFFDQWRQMFGNLQQECYETGSRFDMAARWTWTIKVHACICALLSLSLPLSLSLSLSLSPRFNSITLFPLCPEAFFFFRRRRSFLSSLRCHRLKLRLRAEYLERRRE